MFEHEHECSNEWEHEMWMIKHEIIIKRESINEIDAITMLNYLRLSKE